MGLDPHKPFCRAEARRAGIPVKHLSSSRFRKLFYDVYVGADVAVSPLLRAAAVLGINPAGSHASHHTAAQIWGGIVPDQPLTHVSSPSGGNRPERQGVGSHRTASESDVVTFGGVRVSGPEQTVIDLADELSLVHPVMLGDSLVRKGRTTPGELVAAAAAWMGKGRRTAARAAGLVRTGVDSPMETRLRLLIEYDGRQHADDPRQYDRDILRREELDTDGWRLIIIQAKGIYVDPANTLERIVDVMRERGARACLGR